MITLTQFDLKDLHGRMWTKNALAFESNFRFKPLTGQHVIFLKARRLDPYFEIDSAAARSHD